MPIAAMIARPDLDILGDRAIGRYTHEKNPVSCRAALTTIEIIEQEGLVENARAVGAYALERLHEMAERHPLIGDIRGLGLLIGAELVLDRADKTPANDAAEAVMYAALEKGLSIKVSMGNILCMTPPLIVSREEMDWAMTVIDACMTEVGKESA